MPKSNMDLPIDTAKYKVGPLTVGSITFDPSVRLMALRSAAEALVNEWKAQGKLCQCGLCAQCHFQKAVEESW